MIFSQFILNNFLLALLLSIVLCIFLAYYVTSMGAAVEFIDTSYAEGAEGEEEDGAGPHDLAREKDEEEFKQESLNIIKEKELGEAAVNHLGELIDVWPWIVSRVSGCCDN